MRRLVRMSLTTIAIAGLAYLLSAAVFVVSARAPAALVVFGGEFDVTKLPAGVSIIRWDRFSVVVSGDTKSYVADLYKAGAVLVLPVRKNGCVDYRTKPYSDRP